MFPRKQHQPIAAPLERETPQQKFVAICVSRGFTAAQGEQILAAYRRLKAVKLDTINGFYVVAHGALLDADVMQRALGTV